MAVTRLERKARKNKSRAKDRIARMKRNSNRIFVQSPYREESGIVLEKTASEVAAELKEAAKAAPKKAEKKTEEAAPVAEAAAPAEKKAEAKAEKAPAKAKKETKSADKGADKLNKVEGIGPKIASVLNEAGINSFAELAKQTPEGIREILDNAEGNFKAHDPGTWPKQAEMAANGKWDELKTWQDELKGGK